MTRSALAPRRETIYPPAMDDLALRIAATAGTTAGGRLLGDLPAKPAGEILANLAPAEIADWIDSPKDLELLWVREMDEAEVRVLLAPKVRVPIADVDTIRARHHAIARMLVAGATQTEAAEAVGSTPQTITKLLQAPAFKALMLEYSAMADAEAIDLRQRISVVAGLGLDDLTRRLADPEEVQKLPTKELREVAFGALDRIGHGPTQKVQTTSMALTPEDIRELKLQRRNRVVVDTSAAPDLGEGTTQGPQGPGHPVPEGGLQADSATVAGGANRAVVPLWVEVEAAGRHHEGPAGGNQADAPG